MINKLHEKAIALLLEQGNFSINDVSKALNIDKKLITKYLKDNEKSLKKNLSENSKKSDTPKANKSAKQKIKQKVGYLEKARIILGMYAEGKSMRSIQRESHISYDTISKVLKENNIKVKINKILTTKDREEIAKMYLEGALQPEIAERFSVSVSTIKHVVKKMGVIKFNRIDYPEKYTKKVQNEIIKLYKNEEAGIQKISRELKVSQTAIRKLLAEKNIEINASQRYKEEVSENLESEIIQMYQSGIGCIPIKNKLNISREKVKNTLKKHGLYKDWLLDKLENSESINILYKKGNTLKQISKKTGEKESVIEKFLKANDFIKEEKIYKPENLSDEQYQAIIDLYLQGKNMMEISKKMNINYSYVATIIKKTKGLKDKKISLKAVSAQKLDKTESEVNIESKNKPQKIKKAKVKIDTKLKSKNIIKDRETFIKNKSNLTSVPDEIADFKSLKVLDLSDNQLTEIPDFIYKLTNLESINFSGNQLKKLSPSIKKLKNLKYLDLKNNNLSSIPKDLILLNKLEYLDVSQNPVKNLPKPESYFFSLAKFFIDVRF